MLAALEGLTLLVRGELRTSAEFHAARFGSRASLAGTDTNQVTLKFGQATKYSGHQATVWGGGVCPDAARGAETGPLGTNSRQRIEQIPRRAGQPVQACYHQHVTGVECVEQATQLRAVGL